MGPFATTYSRKKCRQNRAHGGGGGKRDKTQTPGHKVNLKERARAGAREREKGGKIRVGGKGRGSHGKAVDVDAWVKLWGRKEAPSEGGGGST